MAGNRGSSNAPRVVVVGAGMAGLQCARALHSGNFQVTVLDKGSRPGGRMATRPIDGHLADYGAQYLESRSQEFRLQLRDWQAEGLARLWGFGFEGEAEPSGLARYLVEGGMNRMPALLGDSLGVRTRTEVESVSLDGNAWMLRLKESAPMRADALVLTCPVPQAIALLRRGEVELDRKLAKRLDTVLYEPCFTLIAQLSGDSGIPCPGALSLDGHPLAWIADNQQKGVTAGSAVVTIHAGPEFSTSHFDDDRERVIRLMEQAAGQHLASPVRARHLHRWRYARPRTPLAERVVVLQEQPLLLLAGDACGGRDVEAAALSGMAAAKSLLARLREGSPDVH
ncbi:MAG: FAD-dependent oxidoreductase [Bryobacterales bacterium]|nr:FAD-dependent oxidoreductase [Bryobacterales bacterium]